MWGNHQAENLEITDQIETENSVWPPAMSRINLSQSTDHSPSLYGKRAYNAQLTVSSFESAQGC